VGRAILGAVLAAAAIAPAGAAEVVFRPSLSFGVLHDGNVDVVGTGRGDDAAQIWADLAVDRTGPQSKLSFVYTPSYRKYRNASDLDYFGNAVVLSYAREPSRRTRTVVNVDATRSDTQGIQSYNTDRPLTFVPRTTTYRFLGDVAGTVGLARRSLIDWEARVQSDRYDSTDTTTYINSASVAALGGWRYEVSERSTIGLALRVDWFVYEDKPTIHIPDVVTETLSLSGTASLGRGTDLAYGAGASLSGSDGTTQTSPAFFVTVSNRRSERMTLDAGARQAVGTGTGIGGGSLDRGAWVGFTRSAPMRGLRSAVHASYWFRRALELVQQASGEVRTADLTGTIGWTFNRYIGLDAAATFVDQHSPTNGTSSADTNYASYGILFRWAIRGR